MALIVGNLLTDPAAQSFISREDACTYLSPERIEAWFNANDLDRDAALVRASRWLAGNFSWNVLRTADLVRVGQVTARLAAETMSRPIFAGVDAATVLASESVTVGKISESKTYREGLTADAAGLLLPWLRPSLAGLIKGGNVQFLRRA